MEEEPEGDELEIQLDIERPPTTPLKQPGDKEAGSLLPAPQASTGRPGGQLALPTRSELELMLQSSVGGDSLADLEKAAATLLDVAKRQDLVQDKLVEIAEWHLRVKRKLGVLLAQTSSRGGIRAKAQPAPLLNGGLPPGLDRSVARRCRQLARIANTDWDAYLESTRALSRMPSAQGALKFGRPKASSAVSRRSVRKKTKSASGNIEVSPHVLDAIERCLGEIDICVGDADVKCRRRVPGARLTGDDLQGTVIFSARVDPGVWLKKLVELRQCSQCRQVVVLLPTEPGFNWLNHFSGAPWHLCFLAGSDEPVVVAFIGVRTEGFFAAMHEHGLVVRVLE